LIVFCLEYSNIKISALKKSIQGGLEKMESEETKRKAIDAKHEFQRQLGITIGKSLFAIGLVLLIPTIMLSVLLPLTVFCSCLGVIIYIMAKHEEWFYLKRTTKSSTALK
jgi:hypothetical protein